MPIIDVYGSPEHRRNVAHFASIATLAAVDGEVAPEEQKLLDRFAHKLNITEEEYKMVMKKENKFPMIPPTSAEKRMERFYDLFRMVFADRIVDDGEMALLKKYAIALGYPSDKADGLIEKSVAIFSGHIDFEDYMYLMGK
ncbi:MAG: TerB family tellurite resistance protein [Flavobacteriaceae bacterium]